VTEFLGRDRYQRTIAAPDAQPGSRNGYQPVTVKTTAGPVSLERPKLRGTATAFASRLFGKHVTKTNALESLVIASFVRGLSVRDVEATLADALGDQAAISKSTVSQVCQAIKTEYDTWARRRLDDVVLELPVFGCLVLADASRLAGRTDPGRLGYHHRRQTRLRRPGCWRRRVDRCLV
jgi:putative transposase